MNSDNMSATKTYVMWHEEHLWNVSVLRSVYRLILLSLAVG
jgi:hypothetical protein